MAYVKYFGWDVLLFTLKTYREKGAAEKELPVKRSLSVSADVIPSIAQKIWAAKNSSDK